MMYNGDSDCSSCGSDDQIDGGPRKKARTIKPLSTLSFREVKKNLEQERLSIPETAESRVACRRKDLEARRAQLEAEILELEKEKKDHFRELKKALDEKRARALEFAKTIGGPDMYCKKCNEYYSSWSETDNMCNFRNCRRSKSCPGCYDTYRLSSDSESENEGSNGKTESAPSCSNKGKTYQYNDWNDISTDGNKPHKHCSRKGKKYEYYGWSDSSDDENQPSEFYYDGVAIEKVAELLPSSSPDYSKCWICKLEFCEKHFPYHYRECRAKARKNCGFKPPSGGYSYDPVKEGCVHVPGHCGRALEKHEKYRGNLDTYLCCHSMTICRSCVSICRRCERPYCKVCAKEKKGCMGDSWKHHRCGPPEEDIDDRHWMEGGPVPWADD